MKRINHLQNKANFIRKQIIEIAVKNGAGHIAPSLSSVDMLVALYYKCMQYNPKNPHWDNRDRLIFSKGHGCYGVYAILSDKGILPAKAWQHFYTEKSNLSGCIERDLNVGLEASCGSLGHGLPMAVGIAFGAKLQRKKYTTYCIVGDGEMQEGSVWEALQFAVKHELNNLVIIIDCNRLQAMDFITNVLDKKERELVKKLKGFGLSPILCPGHNVDRLVHCIQKAKSSTLQLPNVVIAETVKGYGLKCMENVPKFHFRIPTREELLEGISCE